MDIPLFPLSGIVLPGGRMPLRLFEPRYINMVKDCFKNETGFGVCLIKEGGEVGEPAEPYLQGTVVNIIDFDQGDDGLLHIMVEGKQEFKVLSYEANTDKLLMGKVELMEPSAAVPMTADYMGLSGKLGVILQYIESDIPHTKNDMEDPTWVCNRLLELLPLTAASKFEMLQLPDTQTRLDALLGLQIEFAKS